jgi:hypothetical protein
MSRALEGVNSPARFGPLPAIARSLTEQRASGTEKAAVFRGSLDCARFGLDVAAALLAWSDY